MKTETKINDLKVLIDSESAAAAARTAESSAKADLERAIHFPSLKVDIAAAVAKAVESIAKKTAAERAFAKIPADRRKMASSAHAIGLEIGQAACRLGGDYSGDTAYSVRFGLSASAWTDTSRGDQYSRSCKYSKTNALHTVTIDPAGIPALIESEALRQCSIRDGLHLIALYPDSSAVWVRSKGKAIDAEKGWIIGNGSVCYHSHKSAEDAQKGFARKLKIHNEQQRLSRAASKIERRARLISRLCGSVVATIADAKALGYCAPGIAAFQSAHNIGDSATLPELVRTGNPSAVALALSLARKISQKKELQTA